METGYGTVNWMKDEIRFDQTKSPLEAFLKDLKISGQTKFWLETCNVHALACAVAAIGGKWKYGLPIGPDGKPFYDQAMHMFNVLYSSYGQTHAKDVRDGVCENEVIANLVWIVKECAFVEATIQTANTGQALVSLIDAALKRGSAVVLSYMTDYGSSHYVTLVHRIGIDRSFVTIDPWGGNMHCLSGGVRETYHDAFFVERCASRLRFIEVSLPK